LVNTRSVQHDELHKESVASQIRDHIDSATAVLILANGTVSRGTVGIDDALSTLSSIFPETPTNNISLLFTNVWSPICLNVCEDTVPSILQNAPQFQIDNPIALQKKYAKLKGDPNMKAHRMELRKVVKVAEQEAKETVRRLFGWMEGLEPQTTIKNPPMTGPAAKEAKIPAVSFHPARLFCSSNDMVVF
jgi:hypothetical protein